MNMEEGSYLWFNKISGTSDHLQRHTHPVIFFYLKETESWGHLTLDNVYPSTLNMTMGNGYADFVYQSTGDLVFLVIGVGRP